MNGVLLGLIALWLLALTLLLANLTRQVIGVAKLGLAAQTGRRIDRRLPEDAVAVLERIGAGADVTVVIFAAGCARCVRQARLIDRADVAPARTLFLVTGPEGDAVDELAGLLAPTGARLVYEPDALALVTALGIDDTPFAFLVSAGEVVAQSYLGRTGTFRDLVAPIREQPLEHGRR